MVIGVDTGGTFTDFVAVDAAGRLRVGKVPSTPSDPSKAILSGLRQFDVPPSFALVHGTTVATNALLERRGAKTALLTTQGCRDVLEIARQTRDELYSLAPTPRDPLIPRFLRFEVPERLDWQGCVLTPLDTAAVEQALDAMQAEGVESLAVCFLFAYLRSEHEEEVGRRARRRGMAVSLSSEVAPETREYERTSTVCANAFVLPVMARYLNRLEARLTEAGVRRLSVMQSNGGTLRATEAAANAVKTVLSGPAGGLVAAVRTAQAEGIERIMTFDMGGTSTDVALYNGTHGTLETMRNGVIAGLPLLTPMLDIHTVGAGGGSLLRQDRGGALRVGPESAGAEPGPVAYGRGTRLTVTDANVLLGRLPPVVRLAARLPLDSERVRAHFAAFADALSCSPEQVAEGVLAVVNAQMARALRHISTERGRDPKEYTLVAFGGAGGLHACALADAMQMQKVLIPRYPGAFSALGLALADVRRETIRSFFAPLTESETPRLRETFSAMVENVQAEILAEGVAARCLQAEAFLEAQYVGQSYALRVPFRPRSRTPLVQAQRTFHQAHRRRYGYADPALPVEIVAVGVLGIGMNEVTARLLTPSLPASPGTPFAVVPVIERGATLACPCWRREELALGQTLTGPAVILQDDSTTYLSVGWRACVDAAANLLLTSGSTA